MDKIQFDVNGVTVNMDKEEVSKAIETGKVELKSDDLVAYSKEDFETFTNNLSAKADKEYIKGRVDSAEMLQKALREKAGFDFSVKVIKNETDNVDFEKTAETLIQNITPEFETKLNIKPNEKIQELETKFNTLQQNYTNLETTHNEYKQSIIEKETRHKKDTTLLGFIPDNLVVDKDIALLALKQKAGLDIDFTEDGKPIAIINGQKTQDKLMQDVLINEDIVSEKLMALNLLAKKEGGKGEGDNLGDPKASDYDKFVKEMSENGIEQGSEKFQQEMNIRISNKTLKI